MYVPASYPVHACSPCVSWERHLCWSLCHTSHTHNENCNPFGCNPSCCNPCCCNPSWSSHYRVSQATEGCGMVGLYLYGQNICQTFLALHHFLGELHQPHSIFGSWFMHLRHPTDVFQGWEADICRVSHAPLMTSHLLTWQLPWVSRDLADPAIWSLFEVVTMPSIMSEAPLQEH